MGPKDSKNLGNWGKMTPVNDSSHITQTNSNADAGLGAHVTTNIPGMPLKVHDFFDANGNYLGSDFADR